MTEETFMTSYQLIVVTISALGVVATFIKLFSDTRHLNDKLSSLSEKAGNPKGDLSQEHTMIQRLVENNVAQASSIEHNVLEIRSDLDETKNRLNQMNGSEQEVRGAIDVMTKFLSSSQTARVSRDEAYELLYSQFESVQAENIQLKSQISELEMQLDELESAITKTEDSEGPQLTKRLNKPI